MSHLKNIYENLWKDILEQNSNTQLISMTDVGEILKEKSSFLFDYNQNNSLLPRPLKNLYHSRSRLRTLNLMAVHNIEKWMRNDYDKNLYQIERNLLLARILINKGYAKDGSDLLLPSFKRTIKYAHTSYTLLYAHELALRFAMMGNYKQYEKYNRIIKVYQSIQYSEQISMQAYYNTVVLLVDKWAFNPSVISRVKKNLDQIYSEVKKHPSHINLVALYRHKIILAHIEEQYEKVIIHCKKFEGYLLRNAHLRQDAKFAEIAHYLLNACIVQKKFKQGLKYIYHYERYFNKGNYNYLSFMETKFQMLMHWGKYEEALHIYDAITSTSLYKNAPTVKKEIWKINKAYLDFARADLKALKNFRPSKFLNDFEKTSKDKQGLSFEMIVIAFVYMLFKRDFEQLDKQYEYLLLYLKRYINRKLYFRNYYFAKLILLVFKYNYNIKKIERVGEKYRLKLEKNFTTRNRDKSIVEIIPYDKLWLMILKLIKNLPQATRIN
jgi:hypothetical protein